MQVAVLNGVNLDVLGDRDPELYGGLGLGELETRIYAWARELGCTARCFQTNHEGQFVEWCHDTRRWASGLIVNPGAWSHYSYAIRDALELCSAPVVEVHLSNIEEREEWRRHSVIADVVTHRIIGKGPDGLPRGAGLSEGAGLTDRRSRLRAALDGLGAGSFLVTKPVNVRYLTGFESSNAALVVGRDRLVLATDGRYVEAAARSKASRSCRPSGTCWAGSGARLGELAESAGRLRGRPRHRRRPRGPLRGRCRASAHDRRRRRAAGGQGRSRARTRSGGRPGSPTPRTSGSRGSSSSAAPRQTSPGGWSRSCVRRARRRWPSRRSWPPGRTRRCPTTIPASRKIGPGETVIVDAGAQVGGYCSDCTRTFATGSLPDGLAARVRALPLRAGERARRGARRRRRL